MKVLVSPQILYKWRARTSELADSHLESSFVDVELKPEREKLNTRLS